MGLQAWRDGLVARWRASTRLQDALTSVGTFLCGLALNVIGLTDVLQGLEIDRLGGLASWWHTVLLAIGCAVMLVKRRHPMLALGAGVLVIAADTALGGSIAMILVLFDLLFSAGQFASARARAAVMTGVFVTIGTLSVVVGLAARDIRLTVLIALQLSGLLVVPLWWATNLRQQRELGELTARQAARDASHAERSAMARELHDVIASHLSTTAIHSGAALALPPDTERDRAALRAVRTSSLAALEEMRTMIMLLRADAAGDQAAVPAGLAQLAQLVESSGLEVSLEMQEGMGLPALVDHAAYRIVHEALTNVRKHAQRARVRIEVHTVGDHVRVTITNTLPQPPSLAPGPLSAGTGLVSMRERAGLLGGEVTAGREGDVWHVEACLPLHSADRVRP